MIKDMVNHESPKATESTEMKETPQRLILKAFKEVKGDDHRASLQEVYKKSGLSFEEFADTLLDWVGVDGFAVNDSVDFGGEQGFEKFTRLLSDPEATLSTGDTSAAR